MNKLLALCILMFSFLFIGCDSGSSSGGEDTPPPQPSYTIVNCSYCNGGGIVLNPYDGNYYYCENCNGIGKIQVGYQPSFTGGGHCEACASEGYSCIGWNGSSSHGGPCGRKVAAGVYCKHGWAAHHRGY